MRTLLVLPFIVSSLTACAIGRSLPLVGSVVAAASHGSAKNAPVKDATVKQELVAYYQKLDHKKLFRLLARDPKLSETIETEIGRDLLWQSGNPDPTWIKVWGTNSWANASRNAETLAQAAFNRTWEAACQAEFEQTRTAHARLTTQFAPELAAVDATGNHHARMAGYIALAARFEEAAAAAGLDVRKDPFGPSGFRIAIAQHAVAYHQGSRASYTTFPWGQFALADSMREWGRLLSDDEAFERQAYCSTASENGGLLITGFTAIWSEGNHAAWSNVAWPTVWGDESAVKAKVKEQIAAVGASLEVKSGISVDDVHRVAPIRFHEREPRLAAFSGFKVEAVSPAGAGVKVTLSRLTVDKVEYGCKKTREVIGIQYGRFIYRHVCKTGEEAYALAATVSFDELPPGVTLAKGDEIDFTADVTRDDIKKVKDTAAKVAWTRKLEAEGRLLGDVTRSK